MLFKKSSRTSQPDAAPAKRRFKFTKKSFNWAITANVVIVIALLLFVTWTPLSQLLTSATDRSQGTGSNFQTLDTLSSVVMAHSLASLGNFREATWLEVQASNVQAISSVSAGGLPIIAKPVIIDSTVRTRQDILPYVVLPGDTISSLANDFNVSASSIRWSNNLTSNKLQVGQTIFIPPSGLNGIVHRVDNKDSLASLSARYNFSIDALLNFNDLPDLDSLPLNEYIFLPEATPVYAKSLPATLEKGIDTTSSTSVASTTSSDCVGCGPIRAGGVIGKMGNTGWSTGPHLHLEVFAPNGRRYNPWTFINRNRLRWPVQQSQRRVTQVYHSGHRGLDVGDLNRQEGANILAIADGQVIHRGCIWPTSRRWSTFGVVIDHGSFFSLYIHLQAPNNRKYTACSINRRSQYGVKSIDYSVRE